MDNEKLAQLSASWQAKHDEASTISGLGAKATPEQLARGKALLDECDEIGKSIDAYNAQLKAAEDLKARTDAAKGWANSNRNSLIFPGGNRPTETPDAVKNARVQIVSDEFDRVKSTGGFKSLGHFAYCVTKAGRSGNEGEAHVQRSLKTWDDIRTKAPSGMFEDSDPDGGNLVPPAFSNSIYERMTAGNNLLSYLSAMPVAGNTMVIPALKEDSRANGSRHGGVQGYWDGEADQYTSTRPKTRNISLKLHKLTVLTYVTEELLSDSPIALESYLGRLVPKEINFKINDAVINGDGVGKPVGILAAGSKITAAAVSGQGASTIVFKNVLAMYKRIVSSQRGSVIWAYNQEAEDQLYSLFLPTGTSSGVAIFKPNEAGNGFTLMGRPALSIEACAALGTEGDLIAFATEGYAAIIKGGIESFMSMHLRFDYDEFAYKWRFRMDGQPYDNVALTPFKGSATVSSIVTLNSTRT